jgi:hypothetical protein
MQAAKILGKSAIIWYNILILLAMDVVIVYG